MARDFIPKKFYRLAGFERISDYMTAKGWEVDFPAKLKKGEDAGDIIANRMGAAFVTEPEKLKTAESDFRRINDLSCDSGTIEMIRSGELLGKNLLSTFEKIEDANDKAFWCFINEEEVFDEAHLWHDVTNFDHWKHFRRIPAVVFDTVEKQIPSFEMALIEYLRKRDGSGRQCKVEFYRRDDRVCIVAHPEGNGQPDHEYEKGVLRKTHRKPVKEMYLVYEPAAGSLRIRSKGGQPVIEKLYRLFTTICLGMDAKAPFYTNIFDLDPLKYKEPEFPTDPSDEVEFVRVRTIKLASPDGYGIKYTIEVPSRVKRPDALYAELQKFPHPLNQYRVDEVTIQIKYGKGRAGSVQAVITKNGCNLGDSPLHEKTADYLKKWKIVNEQRFETTD